MDQNPQEVKTNFADPSVHGLFVNIPGVITPVRTKETAA